MPKSKKTTYPEIDEIREDLDSLRTNVVELTKHIRKEGTQQTQEMKKMLADRIGDMEHRAQDTYKSLEANVKAKPGKSVAMAFGIGVLASMFLARR